MITGIEIPFTLALLYPSLNLWWFKKQQPVIEKETIHEPNPLEGVEIYKYVTKYSAPTYVHVGHVVIPINNSTPYSDRELLVTKYINKTTHKFYMMYKSIDNNNQINKSTEYINTVDSLSNTFKKYDMDTNKYCITLPLKMNHYNYPGGAYLHPSGAISSNKNILIKHVQFERRLPLSITIPCLATAVVSLCWLNYYMTWQSLYNPYYPPFHYKRIQKYFK